MSMVENRKVASAGAPESPKVLLVGDFAWPMYQEACALSLEQLGCEVTRFGWLDDFRILRSDQPVPVYRSIFHRIQYRLRSGPILWRIRRRLLRVAVESAPDIVWFYNVTIIPPQTVKDLRTLLPDSVFCQYSNDNPFSKLARDGFWSFYLESIKYFDMHFAYRRSNVVEYQGRGASSVQLLRSYFIKDDDYPIPADQIPTRFNCDVVFVGHYENDGRVQLLEAICDAGFKLNLFGSDWNLALNQLRPGSPLRDKFPVMPAMNSDYRYAICGAKVALCFLSALNEDTYTRRNFQIPAMKTAMLSQYTDDLIALYQPDVEAVFFKNKVEMLEKLNNLVHDDEKREAIALAGYKKVHSARHDVSSRMKVFLNQVIEYSSTKN